tara:strand:- start:1546 stop:1815 length:270 start_codon:yes stop_codon:yes gene_type:complete
MKTVELEEYLNELYNKSEDEVLTWNKISSTIFSSIFNGQKIIIGRLNNVDNNTYYGFINIDKVENQYQNKSEEFKKLSEFLDYLEFNYG